MNSGPEDIYFSSLFQSTLKGNPMEKLVTPSMVNYGSHISLKSSQISIYSPTDIFPCGYLHSDPTLSKKTGLPLLPNQQIVSSYVNRDINNFFTVKPNSSLKGDDTPIRSGDLVMLEHWTSGRNLHSSKISSWMTKKHFMVTGNVKDGLMNNGNLWR